MRESCFDTVLPTDSTGKKATGAFLGYDFCSEHEWGIKGVLEQFGIPKDTPALGVGRRRVRQVPKTLVWAKQGIREGILLPQPVAASYEKDIQGLYWRTLHLSEAKGLQSAWDEDSFIITSDRRADIGLLRQVYDAILRKDAAVGVLSLNRNPLGGQGLGFAIISRMGRDTLKRWRDADREQQALQRAKKDREGPCT